MTEDVFADEPSMGEDPTVGSSMGRGHAGQAGAGSSQELLAKKIKGRSRTFFVDLKESSNGKFVKISELSRGGQRSTIMFDEEDLDAFLEALQDIKKAL
ncbi:MAG: DNA-binding protein [bacterium]|nr:DNA-binding protein [bacterium]